MHSCVRHTHSEPDFPYVYLQYCTTFNADPSTSNQPLCFRIRKVDLQFLFNDSPLSSGHTSDSWCPKSRSNSIGVSKLPLLPSKLSLCSNQASGIPKASKIGSSIKTSIGNEDVSSFWDIERTDLIWKLQQTWWAVRTTFLVQAEEQTSYALVVVKEP